MDTSNFKKIKIAKAIERWEKKKNMNKEYKRSQKKKKVEKKNKWTKKRGKMQLDEIKQLNEKKKEEEEATGRGRNPTNLASPP